MQKISVYILTYKEGGRIGAAVKSVNCEDEAVVAGSESTYKNCRNG